VQLAFLGKRFEIGHLCVRALEVCLFLTLTCCSCSAASDNDRTIAQFAHTTWGPKQGAPRPVTALAQTSNGYLWVGSPDGLFRFDGVIFEHYQPQSGEPFPVSTVSSLLALPTGDLWIGFSSGTISLLSDGHVRNYTTHDGLPVGGVWSLAQDREGTIWAGTHAGLARLEGVQWKEVGKDWNFPAGLVRTIFLDRQGTLWVSTEDTLVFLPAGTKRFQPTGIHVGQVSQITQALNGKLWMAETTRSVRPIPLSDKRLPSDETEVRVGSVKTLFDNQGALWITTIGDGLRRSQAPELLRGRIEEFSTAVESFTNHEGLSDDVIRAILQDREGNIWVGTDGGLDRFHKTNLTSVVLPFKFRRGTIWAAGDGGVLWVENVAPMVRVHEGHADPSQPFFPTSAISAYRAPTGAIWWLCPFAIYRHEAGAYTKIELPPSFPKPYTEGEIAMTEDGAGALWLAAVEGLFYRKKGEWQRLETASQFAKSSPVTAFTDWRGRAWFGYEGGTIIIVDQGKIQTVFHAKDSLVGNIGAINGDGRHVWVGGQMGLVFFDGSGFRRVIPAGAEIFNSINGIAETSNGSLWLAEKRGAIQIPASEVKQFLGDPSYRVKYRIFDSFDGLPGTYPNVIQGTDGKLWFSTSDGIAWIDPAKISTNALPPPVLIRTVKANDKLIGSLTNLALPPQTSNLQISYTALSLSVTEKVGFRYRLEGVDKDWQDVGSRREAFYNGLGPGKYHFRVIACNNDGVWNEEGAHLYFSIAPAWYQTIWFRGLYALVLIALVWAAYRLRVHQLQVREKTFREAVETMPALAFVADPKGTLTFMNKGWLEYTGVNPSEASASGWENAVHPDDLDRITDQWRASQKTGQPLDCETRLRRGADGVHRWFLIRAVAVRDKQGKIAKWCGAATDIEDRRDAEQLRENLTHASRVSTMGELAASISHELAQPIMVTTAHAKASLQWLECDPPELTEVRKGTERIVEAGTLASEIINRLRLLYKKVPPIRQLVSINEVIQEMARMLATEARRHSVSIETELNNSPLMTVTDRVQLQQVLMNLMLNGIEAMKDRGGVLSVKSKMGENGQTEISIKDTGPGLPKGKSGQIFETFFTTKTQGSGMGLAISKSIVESHGGRIWADDDDERGATFHFTLPAATEMSSSSDVV
jgi:PAS domain S-box-containing protein